MKVNNIWIDGNTGFDLKVKRDGVDKLVIEQDGTKIIIESRLDLIEQALEGAQEDLEFYKPGLGAK